MYRYYKEKKKHIWTNGYIKVEYIDASIQAGDDTYTISCPGEILYFYYTVKISKKASEKKWKKICCVRTYDSPAVLQLLENLEQQKENFEIYGEDSYKMKKFENGLYELFAGGFSNETFGAPFFDENMNVMEGITIFNLRRQDIAELKKCVYSFVYDAINDHNDKVNTDNTKAVLSYHTEDGMLYEHDVASGTIENIFATGDSVEFLLSSHDKNGMGRWEKVEIPENKKKVIKKICDDCVVFEDGYKADLCNLVYMTHEPDDKKLKFGIDEIADDFINAANEDIKDDFLCEQEKYIYRKYRMAIINRTWMCRPEHSFCNGYHGGMDEVKTYVKKSVKEIRKKLQKQNTK